MNRTHSTRRKFALVGMAAAAGLTLSACASTGDAAAPSDGTEAPKETYTIPQQTGVPPWAFTNDADELIGLLPELSAGLAAPLGVGIDLERNSWENALLGLEAGKYVFVPGAGITEERLQKFDFAVALQDGYGFKVKAGNPEIDDDMNALCGMSIGILAGGSVIPALEEQSATCEADGADPIEIKTYPDWAAADLAAQSGQIDASTSTLSSMGYQTTQTPGVWTVTGPEYAFQEIGFAVLKGSEWGPRLVDAFNAMIADGSYAKVFETYDTTSMQIEESRLVTE